MSYATLNQLSCELSGSCHGCGKTRLDKKSEEKEEENKVEKEEKEEKVETNKVSDNWERKREVLRFYESLARMASDLVK
jgi:hypothetical protein